MADNPKGLLQGVRVLDLTRVLAGPYCTMVLGDLGADIIKVEEPGKGDDTRQWGPPFINNGLSAYFLSANRNKRSLTLNLRTEDGRLVLRELVHRSDVLVENFKTGTLDRMGLGWDELKRLRPDLIYCTITGFGYTGPYKDRPGYDFITQALGGLMSITGEENGEPMRVGVAIVDILAGQNACNAIVAALFARERQKTGQRIDISLLDSQLATLTYVASNYLVSGKAPKRYGNAHPNIVPYQIFAAKDGYFAFAAGNDLQWSRFCKQIDHEDWAMDERFRTNPQRVANRGELIVALGELFARKTIEEWLEICEAATVPAAPINSINKALALSQTQARKMVSVVQQSGGERVKMLASPLNIPTQPTFLRYPPPMLGQHTSEILKEIVGYDDSRIEGLKERGII
ncbi:MAG: CoA transferase [Anaerolineales bacterium]